jgi:hypothetical protein
VHWAILDTDVYIGNWERGAFEQALDVVIQPSSSPSCEEAHGRAPLNGS